ncbi:MAG: trypsin-like peptidase domain-containing protein [Gemmatimonadota bacterium]
MHSMTPGRVAAFAGVAVLSVIALSSGTGSEPPPANRPVYRLAVLPEAPPALGAPIQQRDWDPGVVEGARAMSDAFADVAEAVTPTVVRIQSERSLEDVHRGLRRRFDDLFDGLPEGHPVPDFPTVAGGSGILVSADGLILTNNHVISGASRITVTLWDKRQFEATVVGSDPTTDLALVVIDETGLPSATLGDSDALRVGEWVMAIGNPGFRDTNTLDFTVTSGIVSAKGRPLDVIQNELITSGDPAAPYAIEDFIQTDAAINPGNSGGPLVDLTGTVMGVNTAIASATGANQGYGFAVPVNVARKAMEDLLAHGRVRRPLLGISILNISPEDAELYRLPRIAGVLVEDFADRSPAQGAGMERHDVITAIDGVPVERLGQFQRLVAEYDPGDRVTVDVIRFGDPLRFDVELTEADLGERRTVRTTARRTSSYGIGIEVTDLTSTMARERQFRSGAGGALVTDVIPGSPAGRKGIPAGVVIREINRQPIASAREVRQTLESLDSGVIASLVLELPEGAILVRNVRVP